MSHSGSLRCADGLGCTGLSKICMSFPYLCMAGYFQAHKPDGWRHRNKASSSSSSGGGGGSGSGSGGGSNIIAGKHMLQICKWLT